VVEDEEALILYLHEKGLTPGTELTMLAQPVSLKIRWITMPFTGWRAGNLYQSGCPWQALGHAFKKMQKSDKARKNTKSMG